MEDWAIVSIAVTGIVLLAVYGIVRPKHRTNPKDQLLGAKKLLDDGLIDAKDYEKIKNRLVKRIISE